MSQKASHYFGDWILTKWARNMKLINHSIMFCIAEYWLNQRFRFQNDATLFFSENITMQTKSVWHEIV